MSEPEFRNLVKVQEAINAGSLTLSQLVESYLSQIQETTDLNIYVRIFEDEARTRAAALDQKAAKDPGQKGKLFGLIVSIKDVICYAGHPVTAGSKMLSGYKSPFSATAVERLLAEDAIIIGMVNCDEFAMGSSNEHSVYGPTRNGTAPEYIPGGSSGASAVSVQMDTCLVSLGSDTGGSVRQPASFCNVMGIKPTYGRISRSGLIAYASSFDQIGVIGHDTQDLDIVLEVISGVDPKDATSSHRKWGNQKLREGKPTVAWMRMGEEEHAMQNEIKSAFAEVVKTCEEKLDSVDPIDLKYLDYVVPTYYILTTAEASSNLSRYDGVRYGYRSDHSDDLEEMYRMSRTEGFGLEVKRRIMLGTFVLSAGYYDAYFERAQKIRRLVLEEIEEVFKNHDFLILPTTPNVAWKIGQKDMNPVEVYLSDVFTVLANLSGIPAISIPMGQTADGRSFGLQILTRKWNEKALLTFANDLGKWFSHNS